MYKIEFYAPEEAVDNVKEAMFAAGAGKVGQYDRCSWQTLGQGQFRPLEGSDPTIGNPNALEKLMEIKVEMACAAEDIAKAVQALLDAHPYETPAYCYYPVKG